MKQNKSEDNILWGLQQCDKSTFDSFFKDLFPALLLYTEKIVHDKFEAEDISLLAFAKLWEKIVSGDIQFTTLPQVRAYVYYTAKNDSISYLRKVQKRKIDDKLFHLYISDEFDDDPTERWRLESLVLEKVFSEIAKLPEKCQEVVRLRFFNELSRVEIANVLNLSKSTVDSHITYAIRKLKNVISEQDFALLATIFITLSKN